MSAGALVAGFFIGRSANKQPAPATKKAAPAGAKPSAPAKQPQAKLPPVTDYEKSLLDWSQLEGAAGVASRVCKRRGDVSATILAPAGSPFVSKLPDALAKACGRSADIWHADVERAVELALRAVGSVLAGEEPRKVVAAWRDAERGLPAAIAGAGAAALRDWRKWVNFDTAVVVEAIDKVLRCA